MSILPQPTAPSAPAHHRGHLPFSFRYPKPLGIGSRTRRAPPFDRTRDTLIKAVAASTCHLSKIQVILCEQPTHCTPGMSLSTTQTLGQAWGQHHPFWNNKYPLPSLPRTVPSPLMSVVVLRVVCPAISLIKHINTSTCIITIISTIVNIAATVGLAISIEGLAHHTSRWKWNKTTAGFTAGHYPTPTGNPPPAYSSLGAKRLIFMHCGFLVAHKVNGTEHK